MAFSTLWSFFYQVMVKYCMNVKLMDPIDICFVRTFILGVSSYVVGKIARVDFTMIPKGYGKFIFLRAIIGTVAFTCFVYGVKFLPLGIHMIFFNLNPFLASFFAFIFLKEVTSKQQLLCMLIVFSGVLVIGTAKPNELAQKNQFASPDTKFIGIFCSLTVAVSYATVSVLTRKMQELHFTVVLVYYAFFATIVMVTFQFAKSVYLGESMSIFSYNREEMFLLLGVSTFNCLGMMFNTKAL